MRWWRRLSLRTRLMLIGTGGLAVGFALGGVVLMAAFGYAFQREIDAEGFRTAHDVAALVDAGHLPEPVPVAGSQLVQVVDAQGRVLEASIGADRLVPLVHPDEIAEVRRHPRYVNGDRAGVTSPLRVVAVSAGPPGHPQTVIVARPVTELRQSSTLLRTALLLAYPLVVFAPAALAWRVMGTTLRSVDELRAGAEDITGADAGAGPGAAANRLPVPDSRDEIHRLAVTLNDMLDRLAAARARQRAFVADAAHELRSPLTNMRTELEVAQRLDEPVNAAELLADVQRLSRLVDDLLLLARADEGVPLAHPEPVELGALAAEVVSRYAGAEVPVAAEDSSPLWTTGDRDALTRVLTNLLDNAVRHARSGVRVAVRAEGRYAILSVSDDGPGIPAADRERVFDRFTRLDDARARGWAQPANMPGRGRDASSAQARPETGFGGGEQAPRFSDGGGAGLGLAIVRELVRRHGGGVRLADANPGVRAEVRLPAHTPTVDLGVMVADKPFKLP